MPHLQEIEQSSKSLKKSYWLPHTSPSFMEGLGRIFDFGGSWVALPFDLGQEDIDYRLFQYDWEMLGEDLTESMRVFATQNHLTP